MRGKLGIEGFEADEVLQVLEMISKPCRVGVSQAAWSRNDLECRQVATLGEAYQEPFPSERRRHCLRFSLRQPHRFSGETKSAAKSRECYERPFIIAREFAYLISVERFHYVGFDSDLITHVLLSTVQLPKMVFLLFLLPFFGWG